MGEETSKKIYQDFILAASIGRLIELTWEFEFEREAREFAHASVPDPHELLEIVIGFLSDELFPWQGDVTRLVGIKTYIQDSLIPAYDHAQQTASQVWSTASTDVKDTYLHYDFDDFQQMARDHVPEYATDAEREWFIEGFCKKWREEWMDYGISIAKTDQ